MTAADPELASNEVRQQEGGQMMTPASNDGNNNEANDANNNFGPENEQENLPASETGMAFVRPPALPPRPANLVLPHAGRSLTTQSFSHGLTTDGPYTIMPQGKLNLSQFLWPSWRFCHYYQRFN